MLNNLLSSPPEADLTRPPATTWTVQAQKTVTYEVRVSRNVLDLDNPALVTAGISDLAVHPRRFCVIDANVERLYGGRLRKYLDHHQVEHHIHVVSASETTKTMETALDIVRAVDEFGIDRRREPIVAVGGGILLDLVGVVSSLYRRHTPYVRVPTTLIGLVDAGVGVKTGVNFGEYKNRLGTYEAPVQALLDRSFIATLDDRHISNGLAEILKIGLIKDAELFRLLEEHGVALAGERLQGLSPGTEAAARAVLTRAVQGMLEELQPNLWELTLERLVDYGHSFSPTLEMNALPGLLHGEAVCVDMALTTVLGWQRGLVSDADRDRILAVMRQLDLPIWAPVCRPDLLVRALADTVRHRDGRQRLPLPAGIGGAVFVNDLSEPELLVAAETLARLGREW